MSGSRARVNRSSMGWTTRNKQNTMIESKNKINFTIFAIMAGIPLVAEYVMAKPGNVSAIGFHILLYKPFDYAYFLLTTAIFVGSNTMIAKRQKMPIKGAIVESLAITIAWFITSFVAIATLHHALGGQY